MPHRRFKNILPVLVHLVFVLFFVSVVAAQSTTTETPVPTPVLIPETATPNPTEAPVFTPTAQPIVEANSSEATEEPTVVPSEEPLLETTVEVTPAPATETIAAPIVEVTAEPTIDTIEATVEVTPEISTPEPEIIATITLPRERDEQVNDPGDVPLPLVEETSCRMNVTDAGDDNAFTFRFEATNVNNMASLAWNFGDPAVTTDVASGAGPHNYTYTATGNFTITLSCTPSAGFGSPFTLTGTISISTVPVADFVLSPGVMFTALPPVTINATNTSTGDGLTYRWRVSTHSNPDDPAATTLLDSTAENISFTFNNTHLNASTYPATYYFHLSVRDGANVIASKWQSVVFNAPPPTIDFTLDPSAGAITLTEPLEIEVLGIDLGTGPITTWTWDFGDGSPTVSGIGPHTHSYTVAPVAPEDSYLVTVTATGPGGFHSLSRAVVIYPDTDPVQASATYQVIGPDGGGTEVCFTNTSTGPYVVTEWDFDNNGTFEVEDNAAVVCHTFTGTNFVINLSVTGEDILNTSTATVTVDTTLAPVAAFSIIPGVSVQWGTAINLVDASTGDNLTYAWDFDGDGDIDSTEENPTNIPLTALGQYPIRLTVTNQYGTSYVEHILTITPLTLTCDFSGNFSVTPGSNSQTYTSSITGNGGQPISYQWTISGNGFTQTTQNASIDWDDIGYGSYVLTLVATSQINGAAQPTTCTVSKTVIHNWLPLDCDISGTTSVYATGTSNTYTANVANMGSRAGSVNYIWTVNGATVQTGSSNTFNWTSPVDTSSLPANYVIAYNVSVNNGPGYTPATSSCDESTTVTVQQWPDLICTGISAVTSGGLAPLPVTPSNTTRSYTYQANTTGIQGRAVTYSWSVVGGVITSANPSSSNQVTVRWDAASAEFPPAGANESLSVTITVTNPDPLNPSDNCSQSQSITVSISHLVCNTPTGDTTPVVNETNAYASNITNLYGRTPALTWQLQQLIASVWTDVTLTPAQANASPFSWTFLDPGQTYRVRYTATVGAVSGLPADSCGGNNSWSAWRQLDVWGTGVGFQCESALTGNSTPASAGSYPYSLTIDNGNAYNLRYTYYIMYGSGPSAVRYDLGTYDLTSDGTINRSFTLNQLGPLGRDNQYTLWVEVEEVNEAHTDYSCSRSLALNVGTITSSFTYTAGSWSSNMYGGNPAIPVGQEVCFNNTSTTIPAVGTPPPNYTYEWTVTDASSNVVTTSTAANLPCMSFASTGNYTVSLRVYNPSGQLSHSSSRVFGIYAIQGILINRTGSSFAPSTQNFSATPTGTINSYAWEFRRISDNALIASGSGQTPSQYFASAGQYRAIVRGTGPLGVTSASLDFELLATSGISAGFKATQYGGVAPMNVCFTDTSISLTPIIQWEWDFDGDGTYDLTYNASNIPSSICHTYSTPGTVTTPRLRVTNGSNTATATRPIRTYNPVESASSFSITPNGNGSYCFTAQIPTGVTVVGWDFGDGATGGAQEYICHSYGASGAYIVSMHITDGTVVREIEVVVTNNPPPQLSITALCSDTRVASFIITNNGGDMSIADIVKVYNGTTLIASDTVLLDENEQATFTYSNQSGVVSLTTVDNALTGTTSTTCYYPPELSVAATCGSNSLPIFTVTNTRYADGPMAAAQNYTIRNSANVIVAQGTFQLGLNQQSVDIPVPLGSDPYETYTFDSTGDAGTLTQTHNCATRPVLAVSGECANPLTFTIRNDGGAMVVGQNYQVTNLAGSVIVASGTLNIAANDTETVSLPSNIDPYAGYIFATVSGFVSVTPYTLSCSRPIIEITSDCAYPIVFTVRNTGGNMLVAQDFTIVNGSSATVQSSTLPLLTTGQSTTYTLTGLDPYAGYTFSSSGGYVSFTGTQNCTRPVLEVSSDCAYPIVFTVRNTSGDMLVGEAYTIVDSTSAIVQTGTISALTGGQSTTFTLTGLDPYAEYTFSDGSGFVTFSLTQNCERPVLVVSSMCADPITFTVENTGGDMLVEQPFTVTQGGTTVQNGNLNLVASDSTTITLTAGINPYLPYVFSSSGAFVTIADYIHDCEDPAPMITSVCADPIVFTIENTGGDMLIDQNYEIVDASNVVIASGTIKLAKAANTTISLPAGIDPYASYTLRTTGGFVSTSYTHDCANPNFVIESECAYPVAFTITNTSGDMLIGQAYTVIDQDGVTVTSGTLDLAPGASTTFDLADANPYEIYMLQSGGFAGIINFNHACQPPVLQLTTTCIAPIHFTIRNIGADMLTPHTYTLTIRGGENVTPRNNEVMLRSGESMQINVPYVDFSYDLNLRTGDFGIVAEALFSCVEPTIEPPTEGEPPVDEIAAQPTVTPTRAPVSVAANTTTGTTGNSNFTPISAEEAVDWANVPVCGYSCPTFRMYHTDETGDWEVFRLDGANAETRESIRQNLTMGEGEGIEDLAPSLSPNTEWIVFSSNRDGNWEIYVAPTSGGTPDSVQRITYNDYAIDTDPVWGPNNYVVFETTRNGSWDLYAIDMSTGRVFPLMDELIDSREINPFWSPDGSKIVFQSNRPDEYGERKWQIYELELASGNLTRLSDGTTIDTDPQYSSDGSRVLYRRFNPYVEGSSSLWYMNADGSNPQLISEQGSAIFSPSWSPNSRYIAYHANLDGDLDVYVYEVASGITRKLTDNNIDDYAPTWNCDEETIIFTSEIGGNADIYEAPVQPITDGPLRVEEDAEQLTFDPTNDMYPLMSPSEENSSREGRIIEGQDSDRFPNMSGLIPRLDPSSEDADNDDWQDVNVCPA